MYSVHVSLFPKPLFLFHLLDIFCISVRSQEVPLLSSWRFTLLSHVGFPVSWIAYLSILWYTPAFCWVISSSSFLRDVRKEFETFYIWKTFILHSPLVDQMAGYKTQVLKYFPFTFLGHVPFFFGSFKIFIFIVWKSQWCALIWVYFHLFHWLLTALESCFPSVLGDFFLSFSFLHPFFLFYFLPSFLSSFSPCLPPLLNSYSPDWKS